MGKKSKNQNSKRESKEKGILESFLNKFRSKRKREYPSLNLNPVIEHPPEIENIEDFSWEYPLILPMAYARIHFSEEIEELCYEVIEPSLNKHQKEHLEILKRKMINTVDVDLNKKGTEEAKEYIFENASKILEELDYDIRSEEYKKILYFLYRDFIGLSRIEPLMHDPYIEDISCDGLNVPLYLLHRKYGSLRTNVSFKSAEELNNFVTTLAQRCGKYISYARPYMDGRLPDGSRVNATFEKEITAKGSTFTIRKFRTNPLTPIDLIKNGTCTKEIMAYLWLAAENGASMLVTGGTATGKTTLLNAISVFVPLDFKIVSIEDTRELKLPHEHWIPAIEKYGFGPTDEKGKRYGEVTMFELLKESFRQNPDYVIVGEVRGKEANVLFQGMASGHGCLGTIHAANIQSVIDRLTLPPIEVSPELLSNLDLLIVLTRAIKKGPSARRVKGISEIVGYDEHIEEINTERAYSWDPKKDEFEKGTRKLLSDFIPKSGNFISNVEKEIEDRKKVLDWMVKNDINSLDKIAQSVNKFREEREEFLNEIEEKEKKT